MSFTGILLAAFFAPLALILGFFFLYVLSPLIDPFVAGCDRARTFIESQIEKRGFTLEQSHDDKH